MGDIHDEHREWYEHDLLSGELAERMMEPDPLFQSRGLPMPKPVPKEPFKTVATACPGIRIHLITGQEFPNYRTFSLFRERLTVKIRAHFPRAAITIERSSCRPAHLATTIPETCRLPEKRIAATVRHLEREAIDETLS